MRTRGGGGEEGHRHSGTERRASSRGTGAAGGLDALKDAVKRRAGNPRPYAMSTSEFDVAFITPVVNLAGQSQPNQDFSNWSAYVADIPPVLLIRVTPKMAEPFWAKMARGAVYTRAWPSRAQAAEVGLRAAAGVSVTAR